MLYCRDCSEFVPIAQVALKDDVYETAWRMAAVDHVDVSTLVEDLVRRHAGYVAAFEEADAGMPSFHLDDYEMQRDPGENDAAYSSRQNLFK